MTLNTEIPGAIFTTKGNFYSIYRSMPFQNKTKQNEVKNRVVLYFTIPQRNIFEWCFI